MQKKSPTENPDIKSSPDVRLTDEMKHLRVPKEQSCRTMPKVKCPVKGDEYCVFDITRVTPGETDYACPACGEVVKKDVLTNEGWKTQVLDERHESR